MQVKNGTCHEMFEHFRHILTVHVKFRLMLRARPRRTENDYKIRSFLYYLQS